MTVEMIDIEGSTNVKAVGYDPAEKELHIQFHSGNKGKYKNVEPHEHADLMAADSKGKHLNSHIKPKHEFERTD